jgi:hypothetical protein
MKVLVFIPSYNDTISAYNLALKFIRENEVERVLLIDESDDPYYINFARKINHEKIDIIRRERSGKYLAWKEALNCARNYDGLIEVDADIEIEKPILLLVNLKKYDVITAYPKFNLPLNGLSKIIIKIYQKMHEDLQKIGKFNMGGQVIALSRKAVITLLNYDFFEEPVLADDHVICLGAYVLQLKCVTVDCGLYLSLPSKLKDWIKYRSRHKKAIKWSEEYVAKKTGKNYETFIVSRNDFNLTLKYFLKNLIKCGHIFSPFVLLLFLVGPFLYLENPFKWEKLK